MDAIELKNILDLHEKWLNGIAGGIRADLSGADLSMADFRGAYLSRADFRGADLSRADFRGADLSMAYFRGAYLSRADFRGADFRGADFYGADFYGADFHGAKNVPFIPMACPEIGSYTAFKKAENFIVVLEIPSDALRSSAATRKCRANKAKVLRIENIDGSIPENVTECVSNYDETFIYRIGEIVEVNDFDTDRWVECGPGIHHFMSRQEAVEY